MGKNNNHKKNTILLLAASVMFSANVNAKSVIKNLKVEYAQMPMAVSVPCPRFAWQMTSDDAFRGWQQSAYQISVMDDSGKEVWNSGKVSSNQSLNIPYAGERLKPATRYQWNLKVWNQKNEQMTESSSFETALTMADDAKMNAWNGAKWIGKSGDAVMFYAPYFPVFRLDYEVLLDKKSKTTAASFLFGANDPRLMDRNKNILDLNNQKDSSYVRVELDIAPLKKKQEAKLNVYRKGYKVGETDSQPIASFAIPSSLINETNKYASHQVSIEVNAGATSFYMDGAKKELGTLNLNPTGNQGGDYIAYPVIADLGYLLQPKHQVPQCIVLHQIIKPQH